MDEPNLPTLAETEKQVLGDLILDATLLGIAQRLDFHYWDFELESHKQVFQAMLMLESESPQFFDPLAIAEVLKQDGVLERVGGLAYISSLYTDCPKFCVPSVFEGRIHRLLEASRKRRLMREASGIIADVSGGEKTSREIATRMKTIAAEVDIQGDFDMVPISTLIDEYVARFEARKNTPPSGLRFGCSALDDLTGGLQGGHLCVIAARPRIGKTTFALQALLRFLPQVRKQIAFYSFEMTAEQIIERLVMLRTQIEGQYMRAGALLREDLPGFNATIEALKSSRLSIHDRLASRFTTVAADASFRHEREGLAAIVIDYLGLLSYDGKRADNRVAEMSQITRGLKLLARELDLPVIALAQLNRAVEARANDAPRLSDLRESGSIEQDADQVLFLTRTLETDADVTPATLTLEKNRHGRAGYVQVEFNRTFGGFQW